MTGPFRPVDLSLPLGEELPCNWPGNMPFQHKVFDWFAPATDLGGPVRSRGVFHTRWFMAAEHTGTHADAPTHWVPPPGSGLPDAGPAGEISVDRVPLGQLIGPAVVVDVRTAAPAGEPGLSPRIGPDVLEAFEARHGPIAAGEIVLLRTGWDERYVEGAAGSRYMADPLAGREPGWPAPTPEAISLLRSRGVRCLGVDTPSVGAVDDEYSGHIAGLAHGMVYVEGLARLGELPVRGATFLFLPLPLRRGSGAPGRAVALLSVSASE
jgi:kynurenine formamidase